MAYPMEERLRELERKVKAIEDILISLSYASSKLSKKEKEDYEVF